MEREAREKKAGKEVEVKSGGKSEDSKKERDDSAMDVDDADEAKGSDDADDIKVSLLPHREKHQKRKFYPETYIFLEMLIALELYDREHYKAALEILERLIAFSKRENRRTSDGISSRLYQFHALCTQR